MFNFNFVNTVELDGQIMDCLPGIAFSAKDLLESGVDEPSTWKQILMAMYFVGRSYDIELGLLFPRQDNNEVQYIKDLFGTWSVHDPEGEFYLLAMPIDLSDKNSAFYPSFIFKTGEGKGEVLTSINGVKETCVPILDKITREISLGVAFPKNKED